MLKDPFKHDDDRFRRLVASLARDVAE